MKTEQLTFNPYTYSTMHGRVNIMYRQEKYKTTDIT